MKVSTPALQDWLLPMLTYVLSSIILCALEVDEFHKVRQQLTAEMADNSGIIRNLVVRAEDARMMNNMSVRFPVWPVWPVCPVTEQRLCLLIPLPG